jgi:hypothetical protein
VTTLPNFSSVPGQAVPGMTSPGRIGVTPAPPPPTTYEFYGHQVLYYPDYLNGNTYQLLAAVPGVSYVISAASGRSPYLTVPPSDGRWVPGSNVDFTVFRPPPPPSLAEVRADLERAKVAHGHYAPGGCRRCLSGGQED